MEFNHTQFLYGSKRENHTVTIGLDFGTSSTKVVINNNTVGKSFAVPFGPFGHPENKYLIPTRPYFDWSEKLCLASLNEGIALKELKGVLMGIHSAKLNFTDEKELDTEVEVLTVAYLAKVIRLSRNWFLNNQRRAFGHAKIDWQLNIGIPSTGHELENKKKQFKSLAISAWWLSVQKGDITMTLAEKSLRIINDADTHLTDIHPANINVIPEIVAEVIGYARSDRRNNGLHLMIDIGAGTVDIASFNLGNNDEGDKYSIFTGDVRWLGAFELHKQRINFVKERMGHWLGIISNSEDPVKAIPNDANEYVPDIDSLGISNSLLDSEFFTKYKQALQQTVVHVRKKRDPNSLHWNTGIPVFICGGGSHIAFYESVTKHVNDWWVDNNTAGLKIIQLPMPSNFEAPNLAENQFHRLAVAYGLSFPEYDIGIIYPPHEIPDITPPTKKDFGDVFIDKDHI